MMKNPVCFRATDPYKWVGPELYTGYDSVNNSDLLPIELAPSSVDPLNEPSGLVTYLSPNSSLAFHFIEDEIFTAELLFEGASGSGPLVLWDVTRNNRFAILRSHFIELVKDPAYTGGQPILGDWRFVLRKNKATVALVKAYV